jgi:hypothetical protein
VDTTEISVGQTYIDDEGGEVTVYLVNRSRGLVVLEGEDGRYEMSLGDLAQAVEDGEFEEATDIEIGDEEEDD